MSASLSGVFSPQEFTDAGALGLGLRLYTYVSGTTTFKAAYTDIAGTIPHTYTADGLGGSYIALNARGELPANFFLASGGYDLTLKRSDGSTVWTRYAEGTADAADSIDASTLTYVPSGLNAVTRTVQDWMREEVHLLDYGDPLSPPVADGVVDCTAAFRGAYAELVRRIALRSPSRAGGRLILPSGSIRITDEIDMYRASSPRIDIEIVGQGQLATQILVDFYGADKSVFKTVDPAGVSRASPITFKGFRMDNVSTAGGINPVFIDVLGWGEASMEDVRLATTNNSWARLGSMQNCRFINVNMYGGGRSFNYKRTGSLTFSVDTATNTITASGAIFSAADVGKYFFVFPPDATRRIRYVISAFTDSTHVTYTGASELAQTSVPGWFEPARCSISLGTPTTLTANSNCFTADMIGLVLYVRGAKTGAWGAGLLRATITAVPAANRVTLDTAATIAVTDVFFSVAAMDCGLPPGYDGSSDVKAFALRLEHYLGTGLVAQNTDSWELLGCKIHGDPTVDDDSLSTAAAWLDDFGGTYQGEFDSTCSMADYRIHWCNANDTSRIALVATRGIINGTVFGSDLVTSPDGYLNVESLSSYISFGDPYDMVSDANFVADPTDPRVIITGLVNMEGDSQQSRYYVGRNTYFTPTGTLKGLVAFFDKQPQAQATTAGAAGAFVAGAGTAVNDASTFDGYTLKQVVRALRVFGLLA